MESYEKKQLLSRIEKLEKELEETKKELKRSQKKVDEIENEAYKKFQEARKWENIEDNFR